MLEVLNFVFSSFWVWLGSVILMVSFGSGVASILLALRGRTDE